MCRPVPSGEEIVPHRKDHVCLAIYPDALTEDQCDQEEANHEEEIKPDKTQPAVEIGEVGGILPFCRASHC